MHQKAQQLVFTAISTLPELGKSHAFAQVQQGPNEPYTKFTDRLHQAIKHPDFNEDMKEQMFRLLAFKNANDKTKQMLGTLPKSVTTVEMIELAEHAYVTSAVIGAIKPLLDRQKNSEK